MRPVTGGLLIGLLAGFLVGAWTGGAQAASLCYQCHDRQGFRQRVVHSPVSGDDCSACHNPHVARHSGLLSRELHELCFSCHEREAEQFRQGIVHEPVRKGECLACHDPHASNSKGLLRAERLDRSCFVCHDNLSKPFRVSHEPFAAGRCNVCHRSHQAGNYQLLQRSPAELCRECHSSSDIRRDHSGYPRVPVNCLSCHNPHGSKRKALVRNELHEPFAEGCGDCHQDGRPVFTAVCLECHEEILEQSLTTHSHLLEVEGNSCTSCHTPHAGDSPLLLKGRQELVCRTCHADTFRRHEDSLFVHEATVGECHECHAVHGSDRPAMLKGDGNAVCSRCHETQGKFSHPVGEKVRDPRNSRMMTCVSCHNPHGTDFKGQLKLSGQEDLCVQCHHM